MVQNSLFVEYSGGSNIEHSKTESIRKPNILKARFWMVQFSNVRNHSYEPTIRRPNFSSSLDHFMKKKYFFIFILNGLD